MCYDIITATCFFFFFRFIKFYVAYCPGAIRYSIRVPALIRIVFYIYIFFLNKHAVQYASHPTVRRNTSRDVIFFLIIGHHNDDVPRADVGGATEEKNANDQCADTTDRARVVYGSRAPLFSS